MEKISNWQYSISTTCNQTNLYNLSLSLSLSVLMAIFQVNMG